MSELPWSINVTNEQARIDIEKMRDALSASLQSLTQAIPQMASQGQDPSDIVAKIASVINAKKKGLSIEDAVTEVFDQEKAESPTAPESPVEPPEAPVGPQVPPEAQNAPTAPTGAPAAAPDVSSILSMLGGAG